MSNALAKLVKESAEGILCRIKCDPEPKREPMHVETDEDQQVESQKPVKDKKKARSKEAKKVKLEPA